jgi:hypothetical protein
VLTIQPDLTASVAIMQDNVPLYDHGPLRYAHLYLLSGARTGYVSDCPIFDTEFVPSPPCDTLPWECAQGKPLPRQC